MVEIPATTEVIARRAFPGLGSHSVVFDAESKLREIAEEAFCGSMLTSLGVPPSVETIGKRCFAGCSFLTKITFGEGSKLRRMEAV
jgi:hypothetical protein